MKGRSAAAWDRGSPACLVITSCVFGATLAVLGDVDRSVQLGEETLASARRLDDQSVLALAIVTAAGAYEMSPEPNFAAMMGVLESNPVDADAVEPLIEMSLCQIRGVAHLGLGQVQLSVGHLARSIRLADRTGGTHGITTAVCALAVICARSDELELAAQLASYARTHLVPYRYAIALQNSLEQEVDDHLASLDPGVRSHAGQTGAALDRRALLQLVSPGRALHQR